MYRDVAQWSCIREEVLRKGVSIRQVARETGIDPKTIGKMLDHPSPQPYRSRPRRYPKLGRHLGSIQQLLRGNDTLLPSAHLSTRAVYEHIRDTEGFRGGYSSVKRYVRTIAPDRRERSRQAAFEWMRAVLQKDIDLNALRQELRDLSDIEALLDRLYDGRLSDRNRSMVVLSNSRGVSIGTACRFLGIETKTYRKYLRVFKNGGHAALFARQTKATSKFNNEAVKQAVFQILHEPPSNYGINRTTWIMPDLSRVLRDAGQPACPQVIRKITKAAGYRWRKARKVLTSIDPEYREKVRRIQDILAGLSKDEAFFSIDEFGPFSVRAHTGKALVEAGKILTVPQHQKSKGVLIMTAALELSQNQITYFYSPRKDTGEMLRMFSRLIEVYKQKRRLYLSWDSASWHMSKMLYARIDEHNTAVLKEEAAGPLVEVAPLPTGAQFLNVIESIFSGMARAIIANSNYGSVDEARAAIARYFQERNEKFSFEPKRAGGKIWGMEREPAQFASSNNCKDPRYR